MARVGGRRGREAMSVGDEGSLLSARWRGRDSDPLARIGEVCGGGHLVSIAGYVLRLVEFEGACASMKWPLQDSIQDTIEVICGSM